MREVVTQGIRDYIVNTWLSGDPRGFHDDTDLQETGILDSFSTLALAAFLEKTFSTQLEPSEINGDTFRSVQTLTQLVLERRTSSLEQRT
ncbi:MAG: acyl carrier protein [Myxococcales bacterium]